MFACFDISFFVLSELFAIFRLYSENVVTKLVMSLFYGHFVLIFLTTVLNSVEAVRRYIKFNRRALGLIKSKPM